MLDTQNIYSSILVRGRRSNPTFEQVRKDAREANSFRLDFNLYRF